MHINQSSLAGYLIFNMWSSYLDEPELAQQSPRIFDGEANLMFSVVATANEVADLIAMAVKWECCISNLSETVPALAKILWQGILDKRPVPVAIYQWVVEHDVPLEQAAEQRFQQLTGLKKIELRGKNFLVDGSDELQAIELGKGLLSQLSIIRDIEREQDYRALNGYSGSSFHRVDELSTAHSALFNCRRQLNELGISL